jgi:hypothetical protein
MIPKISLSTFELQFTVTSLSEEDIEFLEEALIETDWVTNTSVDDGIMFVEIPSVSGSVDDVKRAIEKLRSFVESQVTA